MRSYVPLNAIFISCLIALILNSLGLLRISEMLLYDYFLRSRPEEIRNESIVIVGISEKDIEKLQEFPLEDKTLADLLIKIKQGKPSVIGMDLHRGISIGDGKEKLKTVFESSDNLIGVEKTDGGNPNNGSISPPSELKKLKQTGASQIIEDSNNGIVRRGYLYTNQSNGDSLPSFGLAVALKYLAQKNIYSSGTQKNNWLKLQDNIFPKLTKNFFYDDRTIDSYLDGYQILINYRSAKAKYKIISASEVLENKVKPNFFQDKIVFIGSTAETAGDLYLTPYNSTRQNLDFVYGVEIHAELTDQIISAVLNNRPIIKPIDRELFYIVCLSYLIIISCISWHLFMDIDARNEKILLYLCQLVFILIIPFVCGYLLLIAGWWIPNATIFVTALMTELIVYIYLLRRINNFNKAKLEEARKLLLSQERLRVYSKSASLIAHEIKNKVNIQQSSIGLAKNEVNEIKKFVEGVCILFEPEDESEINKYINNAIEELTIILEQSNKITSIINTIYAKSFKHSSNNKENIKVYLINSLNGILFDLEKSYNSKDEARDFSIIKDFQPNLLSQVKISLEIERALENIIENAFYFAVKKIQHTDKNWIPEIKVSAKRQNNNIELKIKDNGVGIPSKDINKIFIDFWSTKSKGEGMGLGLHLATESILKINGSISVISNESEFTEFTVLLPNSQPEI